MIARMQLLEEANNSGKVDLGPEFKAAMDEMQSIQKELQAINGKYIYRYRYIHIYIMIVFNRWS